MKKIEAIIVKRLSKDLITAELREIDDEIKAFKEIIGCDCIDIVRRWFGGVHFDVILDDEGLLKAKEDDLPTSWWQRGGYTPNKEGLYGTLILLHDDGEGNETSATLEDLLAVQKAQREVVAMPSGEKITILFHDVERRE